MTQNPQDYFSRLTQQQAKDLADLQSKVANFKQKNIHNTIALLTSGGTSVPLEANTVRSIQNFSTGSRGSILAQHLLKNKMSVIFFYRENSCLPFSQGLTLNSLIMRKDGGQVLASIRQNIQKYQSQLLLLPFKSIYYYLLGLLKIKALLPKQSILILCAAVSDFIPKEVSKHKIHTAAQLSLELIGSPKILGNMISNDHLCVSFKLQTDEQKMKQRMQFAIQKYGVDMVIGNILNNRTLIFVKYNEAVLGNLKQQRYEEQVQQKIIERVINAFKIKFQAIH